MDNQLRVVLVEDEIPVRGYIQSLLESLGCAVDSMDSADLERTHRAAATADLFLLDTTLPGVDVGALLLKLRQGKPNLSVVLLLPATNQVGFLAAAREGVYDVLPKPFLKHQLDAILRRVRDRVLSSIARTNSSTIIREDLGNGLFFLAATPAMKKIYEQAAAIAHADIPVLITGESGVGKEVVARLIHRLSRRSDEEWLKINCAALPLDLLESELFGYEAGAFTGATKAKPGKFEMCDKGTLLLDEIGEMSAQLQAKLLQVLQDGSFSRLGGRGEKRTNARILAATNIDIQKALVEKTFREDLYYRLSTFVLHIPPLRERREEIPYVLTQLAQQLAVIHDLEPVHISPQMIATCVAYHWPGNLRELGNFVKRYLVMRDEAAAIADLESKIPGFFAPVPVPAPVSNVTATSSPDLKAMVRGLKDQAEMQAIRETLAETKWNRRTAATRLNISYKALLYKIRQYNLAAPAQSA
ncbi:MAG: sigma-54-dependent transcriptional regulator [Acidobacteriaceae bacterium]